MPDKQTVAKAKRNLKQGKSPSTAAGEFVHQEIDHVREGKHGARSAKQAIAIGLSEARRAGIPVKPPEKGRTNDSTRKKAEHDYEGQKSPKTHTSFSPRSRARSRALKRESTNTANHAALSRQAKTSAQRRRSSSGN